MNVHPLALALAAPLLIAGCSHVGGPQTSGYLAGFGGVTTQPTSSGIRDDVSYWDGDGIGGPPSIRINLHLQKASFYKGDQLVGVSKISTGKEGHDTPPGTYKIIQKNRNHRSNLYGVFRDTATGQVINDDADMSKDKVPPGCVFEGAEMPNFMRFNGGIGMHTGYLPGYNASHGCVRMPDHMALKFFDNIQVGTPVIVE
jgi:hypothetical protein